MKYYIDIKRAVHQLSLHTNRLKDCDEATLADIYGHLAKAAERLGVQLHTTTEAP